MTDENFGAGRSVIIAFDAFCEFMRFDGTPVITGQHSAARPHPSADLFVTDWAGNPERARDIQRATVLEWYHGDIKRDTKLMVERLEEDLKLMAGGASDVRSSWERAMCKLLAGPERMEIRRQLLDPAEPAAR
jgi:hypothetical protein